jgi:RNA polymerase sigma factor (sigma-70 family)
VEPDGVLIERSVRGQPDAFVEVVRRHEVAMHAYLARRAGRQSADDLLGEVWVRAFAARGGFDAGYGDARPWLYGIARNVLREHWRNGGGVPAALGASGADVQTGADSAGIGRNPADWAGADWDRIDERLDAAGRAGAIMPAVRALPPAEREVLLLVAWEQLTPAEAARALGVPPGTARSRLHRARSALRRLLREQAADEAEVGG